MSRPKSGVISQFEYWRHVVENTNACALPGCNIKYDSFISKMWEAVAGGADIPRHKAQFIHDGLTHGFKMGIDVEKIRGHRWFNNYASAYEHAPKVRKAIGKRLESGKTLALGHWNSALARTIRGYFEKSAIFPMGAVEKPLEPDSARPISDHTRTGLNSATELGFLKHALSAYEDISNWLKRGYYMHVTDVEDAFPMLPLHPDVWQFFMFRFSAVAADSLETLYVHLFADFGTRGAPGTFKCFYTDVVVGMARYFDIIKLPMAIYVDDCGLIGRFKELVVQEMRCFQAWAVLVCGICFKIIKDRTAAQRQLMLGFWWDSNTFTRTLEDRKLQSYLQQLIEFAGRRVMSLAEMQAMAGKMHRAILTLPPGAACLLSPLLALMAGLKLAWAKRRTTKRVRDAFTTVAHLLERNLGQGYYSLENFELAPEVRSDACKSSKYTGGGYVSKCGRYNYWPYGDSASRKLIDFLEGDVVSVCVSQMGHLWRKKIVPFAVDNTAFQKSAAKGRSHAPRLDDLCRELFALQIDLQCILNFWWIDTVSNGLADDLSRDRVGNFLYDVYMGGFWEFGTMPLPHPAAGAVRHLPEKRGDLSELDRGLVGGVACADSGDVSREHRQPRNKRQPTRVSSPPAHGTRQRCLCTSCKKSKSGRCMRMAAPGWLHCFLCVSLHGGCGCPCFCEAVDTACLSPGQGRIIPVDHAMSNGASLPAVTIELAIAGKGGAPLNHNATVQFSRASLFAGLPSGYSARLEELLDNRYAPSSWRTINSGLKHWFPVAERQGWPRIIATDDPERGGKLVAATIDMVDDTTLTFSSIENYLWGIRSYMKLQRQADPIYGVLGWDDFLASVKVLTFVPAEPRKATPITVVGNIFEWGLKKFEAFDAGSDAYSHAEVFHAVQFCHFVNVLLATFSRTESPCPKNFTGPEGWNPSKNWQVKDMDVKIIESRKTLAARMKGIKQDLRQERASAKGGHDWVYMGEISDNPLWCPVQWAMRFQKMLAEVCPDGRNLEDSYFLAKDLKRPYTYSAALSDFYEVQRVLGVDEVDLTGLHGLRVAGWNAVKSGLGKDLAQVHGGWSSDACERYSRFALKNVLRIPAVIAGFDQGDEQLESDEPVERPARVLASPLTRGSAPGADGGVSSGATAGGSADVVVTESSPHQESDLPDGWSVERRVVASGSYLVYHGPHDARARSVPDVWRCHWGEGQLGPSPARRQLPDSAYRASPRTNVQAPVEAGPLDSSQGDVSFPEAQLCLQSQPQTENSIEGALEVSDATGRAFPAHGDALSPENASSVEQSASLVEQSRIEYESVDALIAARGGHEWERPSRRKPPVQRVRGP